MHLLGCGLNNMGNSRTGIIVQARYGSSRLTGKVCLSLGVRTVLEEVVYRLSTLGLPVILTVPAHDLFIVDNKLLKNTPIVPWYGDENDVVGRYLYSAREFDLDTIVRVTSDCPLIDPNLIEQALIAFHANKPKYLHLHNMYKGAINAEVNSIHGLEFEIYNIKYLDHLNFALKSPNDRQHINHFERPSPVPVTHRWTLDTAADYRFLKRLFNHFDANALNYFAYSKVLETLKTNMSLMRDSEWVL